MSSVKVLGDHTQSKTVIIVIGLVNVLLALCLPFIALFTSLTAIKRGVKNKQSLKYSINILALIVSIVQMITIPIILSNMVEASSSKHLILGKEVQVVDSQIRPDYLEYEPADVSVVGEVEGVVDKSLDEALSSINKNIEQSKTFYKDENFTVSVIRNDTENINKFIYDKSHPDYILAVDVTNNINTFIKAEELDLFQENTLVNNNFEKGSVVVSKNDKTPTIHNVFIAVQGKSVTYGLMYQTDESVNYAMQKMHQIIVNNTDSLITTYDFKPSTEEEKLLYFKEYSSFLENQ